MESRKQLLEDALEAKRLLGPVAAPSLMWLATLQQAWRYVRGSSFLSSPTHVAIYCNFAMTCFLQFRKYEYSDALAYVLALRGELLTAGLSQSLLDQVAFLQGYALP